ncbi:MAG: hypothetical protein HY908_22015, partial [Myxococcales bacterium]|nr:hypothetical protein [Myxococcales bacterium]
GGAGAVGGQGGSGAGGGQGGSGVGGQGGGGGAGGGQGGQGGVVPPAPPLQIDGSVGFGFVSAHADPLFKLDFDLNENWQLTAWYDLGSQPAADLGPDLANQPTAVVFNAGYLQQGANWLDIEGGTVVNASLYEQWEGRMVLHTVVDYALPNLRTTVEYTVYPSGRVATSSLFENTGAAPIALDDLEHGYVAVNSSHAWTVGTAGAGAAVVFERTDAPSTTPTLVAITDQAGIVGQDTPYDRYWAGGPVTIPGGQSVVRNVELDFWPSSDTSNVAARVADVRGQAVTNLSGVTDLGVRYHDGTYGLDVVGSPSSVTFAPTNAHPRHYPAFYIGNWQSPTWSVWLGGQKLCSSSAYVGARAIACYMGSYALVIVYLDVIPQSATLAERTFTVQTTP